jgi:hypothetical protein
MDIIFTPKVFRILSLKINTKKMGYIKERKYKNSSKYTKNSEKVEINLVDSTFWIYNTIKGYV